MEDNILQGLLDAQNEIKSVISKLQQVKESLENNGDPKGKMISRRLSNDVIYKLNALIVDPEESFYRDQNITYNLSTIIKDINPNIDGEQPNDKGLNEQISKFNKLINKRIL